MKVRVEIKIAALVNKVLIDVAGIFAGKPKILNAFLTLQVACYLKKLCKQYYILIFLFCFRQIKRTTSSIQ